MEQKQQLPNSTAALVLGIISLVFGCSGIGFILGIVGLILSKEGKALYDANPDKYTGWGSLNAGRIMCIISLALSGTVILMLIIMGGTILGILSEVAGAWY